MVIWQSWVARKCSLCLSWHGVQTRVREGSPVASPLCCFSDALPVCLLCRFLPVVQCGVTISSSRVQGLGRGCLCAPLAAPKVWDDWVGAGWSGSATEHSNSEVGTRHLTATCNKHSPVGLKSLPEPGLGSGERLQGREQLPPGLWAQAWWLCPSPTPVLSPPPQGPYPPSLCPRDRASVKIPFVEAF